MKKNNHTLKSEQNRKSAKGNRVEVTNVISSIPIKDQILNFLVKHKGNRFSLTEVSLKTGVSYPSVLKWINVLDAENKIEQRDYKNIKLVWFMK